MLHSITIDEGRVLWRGTWADEVLLGCAPVMWRERGATSAALLVLISVVDLSLISESCGLSSNRMYVRFVICHKINTAVKHRSNALWILVSERKVTSLPRPHRSLDLPPYIGLGERPVHEELCLGRHRHVHSGNTRQVSRLATLYERLACRAGTRPKARRSFQRDNNTSQRRVP